MEGKKRKAADPSVCFCGDVPFADNGEYLESIEACVYLYLLSYIKAHQVGEESIHDGKYEAFCREQLRCLGISEETKPADIEKSIHERVVTTAAAGIYLPLEVIAGAGKAVRLTVVLTWMCTEAVGLKRLVAFLQGEEEFRGLTVKMAERLFLTGKSEKHRRLFEDRIRLLFPYCGEEERFARRLFCDRQLDAWICDRECRPLPGFMTWYTGNPLPDFLHGEGLSEQIGWEKEPFYNILTGAYGTGKHLFLEHLAEEREAAILYYDMFALPEKERELGLYYAIREALVQEMYLAVTGMERLERYDRSRLANFLKHIEGGKLRGIFFLADSEEKIYLPGFYCIHMPDYTLKQRMDIWKYYGESQGLQLPEKVTYGQLASAFSLSPGQIASAVSYVCMGGSREVEADVLYEACKLQISSEMDQRAVPVKSVFTWDDLKLGEPQKKVLRLVCTAMQKRQQVLEEWNFKSKLPYGAGVSVLFAGPPGTGKTMAAQVLAKELHMELYKIDLSRLIDKYVGETEKNIKAVFDQAAKGNYILFFDEADAIFNKRIEAASSNDRFANIESSLLLQCMEEFEGLSILATNKKGAMDPAFMRRFKYLILFENPDQEQRLEIWQSVFPKEVPLSKDVDMKYLAQQFECSGAVIKNAAVAAAYMAAAEESQITILHILRAIKYEYQKSGEMLMADKLGELSWCYPLL